jgi:hypothetical protein
MTVILSFLLMAAAQAGDVAAPPKPPKQSVILPRTGVSVKRWAAYGPSTVYLLDQTKKWHRADLSLPCFDQPYDGFISFVARDGVIDRFATIVLTDGKACRIVSLVKEEPPADRQPISGNALVH